MNHIIEPDWKVRETVEYRLVARGIETISDVELVAITGGVPLKQARNLLAKFGSLRALSKANMQDLCRTNGLNPYNAIALISAFELHRRKRYENSVPLQLNDSEKIASYLWSDMEREDQEVFKVLYLNRSLELLGEKTLFKGGINATVVDPRLIFKWGFAYCASCLAIGHNHPSNNLLPSQHDKAVTQRIKEAGALLEMPLVDHLILTERGYYSFADEGML